MFDRNRPPPPRTASEGAPEGASEGASEGEVAPEPRRERLLVVRIRLLQPWVSLVIGVASALLMDRGPDRAWIAALAAVTVWLSLIALHWLARATDGQATGTRRRFLSAARFTTLLASQSLVQLTLFFSLPFYFQAATLDAGHLAFLTGLCLLSLGSLWDPLTEWILHKPVISTLLPAIGSFAALTAVLPGFGLSTRASLWIAALVSACGVPLLSAASAPPERRRMVTVISSLAALALPLSLYLGAARIVPAAPLKLVKAEMGTRREGKWIADPVEHLPAAPASLICATAIRAPLGLKDRLFHVWRKDGRQRATVELKIVGGRAQGYRTQSRISHFSRAPDGTYSCTVQTLTGQVLGTRAVRIGER